jgi:transposase
VGRQENNNHFRKRVNHPFCPFKKFCVFLRGEDPARVLAQRDYLSKRVDELEFGMDFTNQQDRELQAQIKELEDTKSHLETELVQALKAPFIKYEKKEPSNNPKKRGAPFGHKGHFRQKSEHIDRTLDVYLDCCPLCGSEGISPCNHTTKHTQEDIEDGKLTSTCFVHCYCWCPDCKSVVHGWGENEIPNAFIGPDTRAKAAFLRHEIKVSYNDVQRTLHYLCGLTVVPGSIVGFDNKLAEKAEPLYEELKQSLQETAFIHVDETGWKRDWLWIFTNPDIAFFHIDESRGSKVVIEHFGKFYNGVLISDFWSAYRSKVGAFAKQKCLTHLLRDIRDLLKDEKLDLKVKAFLEGVKDLLRDAIRLHNMSSAFSRNEYRSAKKDILKRFKKLRSNPELEHHETDNIRKRLINFKDELFVFLKYPMVSPTNNPAEQGIRNAVLFRKITFGNMTNRGKRNVSIIMTIIRTAKLRGLNPVKVLQRALTGTEKLELSTAMVGAP